VEVDDAGQGDAPGEDVGGLLAARAGGAMAGRLCLGG
jgi:hypothetical protein